MGLTLLMCECYVVRAVVREWFMCESSVLHVWVVCCSCQGLKLFMCECYVVHVWFVSGSCVGSLLFVSGSYVMLSV